MTAPEEPSSQVLRNVILIHEDTIRALNKAEADPKLVGWFEQDIERLWCEIKSRAKYVAGVFGG